VPQENVDIGLVYIKLRNINLYSFVHIRSIHPRPLHLSSFLLFYRDDANYNALLTTLAKTSGNEYHLFLLKLVGIEDASESHLGGYLVYISKKLSHLVFLYQCGKFRDWTST
jgi:hypothetical protein